MTAAYFLAQLGPDRDANGQQALAVGLSPPATIAATATTTASPTTMPTSEVAIITVVDTGKTGAHNGIAIGTDGLPLIGYATYGSGDVSVAHCGNASCSEANTITTVANAGGGVEVSIVVGVDGLAVISYDDIDDSDGSGGLTLIHCGNAACTAENTIAVVDPSDIGGYVSSAVGADGMPVISYLDTTEGNSHLKIARCGNISCTADNTTTTVDDAGRVAYSAIAVGADGLPIISYIDADHSAGNGGLKVVHCGNTPCSAGNTTTTLDGGQLPTYTSIAMGADGLPLITYSDKGLKVVHCGNVSCSADNTVSTVDSAWAIYYTSIALGADGLPVIAYAEYSDLALRNLKVAHCGDPACGAGNTISTVDTPLSAMTPSLAIGADGLPVITYEGAGGVLLVAQCADPSCLATAPTPTPAVTPTVTPTPSITPTPSATPCLDSDSDGLCDLAEAALGTDPLDPDTDGDRCLDGVELRPASEAGGGGGRDPLYHWDFIDQYTGIPPARDKGIVANDISALVARFGTIPASPLTEAEALAQSLTVPLDTSSYHASSDRGGADPLGNPWDLYPPDGGIVANDIGALVAQFGHTCA